MNWIKKLVPASIEVRSLYWVQKHDQMIEEVREIYNAIDTDAYEVAEELIENFDKRWSSIRTPKWTYATQAEASRAKTMLHFLLGLCE